ncbi:tRNA (guanine(9)-N(1))-methyltransferase [Coemansia sp. RSA 1939]|nr:tRNA (guanine(9)-N(1))-methyltransferase [Coemansia sp. RSA 1939]KAJ2618293.1 tRNA (guanine(9)-N(1))-methyltransferase [Coemansia sp. RSA 1804]KAJ2693629.1 tRNA (guanine(9)-N(1))-methyltransferase [Coemansia sp. RSA 1285]
MAAVTVDGEKEEKGVPRRSHSPTTPAAAAVVEEETADQKQGATSQGVEEEEEKEEQPYHYHMGPSVNTYEPKTIGIDEFRRMSRKQQKKHMRQEMWEAGAEEYKAKRRLKNKESRKRRRAHNREEAEAEAEDDGAAGEKKPAAEQKHSGCRVVIDMDFDDRMSQREVRSVCAQVGRCYAVNRQTAAPVDLHITRLHGQARRHFDTSMAQHRNWDPSYVAMEDAEYLDLFPAGRLVYLTADSPNVIESLDSASVYVIGGIVDKNRFPRLTLEKAAAQGIAHAQLPIAKYVRMATRKVMTVNQIFEMLVRFLAVGDWERAFVDVIPSRKFKDGREDKPSAVEADGATEEDCKEENQHQDQ